MKVTYYPMHHPVLLSIFPQVRTKPDQKLYIRFTTPRPPPCAPLFSSSRSEGGSGLHGVPGGQTREHAALARSLGIEQLAVVVSKLDTVGYDKVCISACVSAVGCCISSCFTPWPLASLLRPTLITSSPRCYPSCLPNATCQLTLYSLLFTRFASS